jgi:hypothetical protein
LHHHQVLPVDCFADQNLFDKKRCGHWHEPQANQQQTEFLIDRTGRGLKVNKNQPQHNGHCHRKPKRQERAIPQRDVRLV